jgi:hypothetical protein
LNCFKGAKFSIGKFLLRAQFDSLRCRQINALKGFWKKDDAFVRLHKDRSLYRV